MSGACAPDHSGDAGERRCGAGASAGESARARRRRLCVEALLGVSEEHCDRVHSTHSLHHRSFWDDAVEGWGTVPPFAVFLQPQRKVKNKQDVTASHCLLCADRDLPIDCPDANAPTAFRDAPATILEVSEETQDVFSSFSSDELYSFSISLQNMPGPLIHKLLSGDEQCITNKLPSLCHYHTEPCQMQKDKRNGLSITTISVLPPVKGCKNLKSWSPSRVQTSTMPTATYTLTADERLHCETGKVIKLLAGCIPAANGCRLKESPSTKNTFDITFKKNHDLPSSAAADVFPQLCFHPVGRHLRQEEPSRNSHSYRPYSDHNARELKRPEAHRLILIGTKVTNV